MRDLPPCRPATGCVGWRGREAVAAPCNKDRAGGCPSSGTGSEGGYFCVPRGCARTDIVYIPIMIDYSNKHEKRARTRKVRRICKAVRDANSYGWKSYQLAAFVLRLGQDDWDALVVSAGCLKASNATRNRVARALHIYGVA